MTKIFSLFLLIVIIFFSFLFINASTDINTDRFVLNEPLDVNKESLYIENIKKIKIPDVKITIQKLVESKKEYKSYIISYPVEKKTLYALLNIPNSKKPGKGFPVIIVNHGYIPPDQYSTVNSYRLVTGFYATNNFIVIKPDYRGFGNSIKEDGGSFFSRINYVLDVLYLINALGSIPEADNGNIFMYGHSMGGDVTLRVLEITDKIKAATLWAPVSAMFPENTLYYLKKRNNNKLEIDKIQEILNKTFTGSDYDKMSALSNTGFIKTPLILQHGTLDDSVPYQWSIDLMKKFDGNKVNYKFYSYTGEDHNFAKGAFYKVLKKDVDFFKSFL